MLKIALASGQVYTLAADTVVRIRRSIPSDAQQIGQTRIDAAAQLQAADPPKAVAEAVKGQLRSLVQFTMKDGTPVWTDAKKAKGPWFVPPINRQDGVQSAFMIANKVQYVAEDPQRVADIISDGGGVPLPVYSPMSPPLETDAPPLPEWD